MNKGKAKLDEVLQAGRPVGLKIGPLGFMVRRTIIKTSNVNEKCNTNNTGMFGNLEGAFRTKNLTDDKKRKMTTVISPRDFPLCVVWLLDKDRICGASVQLKKQRSQTRKKNANTCSDLC